MHSSEYSSNGFIHLPAFFSEEDMAGIEPILERFHKRWMQENSELFRTGLINSHSLTSGVSTSRVDRLGLFSFIVQGKITQLIHDIFPGPGMFLNTQLFFDPMNSSQPNYWHRDIQYNGQTVNEQRKRIAEDNVVHFRVPLKPELGIELIPGSHRNWDTDDEYEVRMSLNGKKPSDSLQNGQRIELDRRDLLVFSANMIHRGIYGKDRFTFDIIFCDATPAFSKFADRANMPDADEQAQLNSALFHLS